MAMEEHCAKTTLQGLDMPGDRRAMDARRPRGITERSKLCDPGGGLKFNPRRMSHLCACLAHLSAF